MGHVSLKYEKGLMILTPEIYCYIGPP